MAATEFPAVKALFDKINLSQKALQTPLKRVITVKADSSLLDGFRVLVHNNILSAPVKDGKTWIGFLDLRDLVAYVTSMVKQKEATTPKRKPMPDPGSAASLLSSPLEEVIEEEEKDTKIPRLPRQISPFQRSRNRSFDSKDRKRSRSPSPLKSPRKAHLDQIIDIAALEPKITVRYLARRNPFKPLPLNSSLWDAMKMMASRTKRIPVMDEKGELVNIVSQSSVMRYLQKTLTDKKVEAELKRFTAKDIGIRPVVSVPKQTPASEVFKVMSDKNLSGIAVIDQLGSYMCSTQASDLKLYLAKQNLSLLQLPIRQFLAKVRQEEIVDLMPNVSSKPSDTLDLVIRRLVAVKMHRVFVADPRTGLRPEAVISISDLLRMITGTVSRSRASSRSQS